MTDEPIWCQNKLTLSGAPKKLEELVEFVKGEKEFDFDHLLNGEVVKGQLFSFRKIIPYQEKWDSAINLAKWGSRAEAINVEMNYQNNCIIYRFLTPWCAPIPVAKELQTKFPDVYVSWYYHLPQLEQAGYIKKSEHKIYKEVL
jgi:hypothetical protein